MTTITTGDLPAARNRSREFTPQRREAMAKANHVRLVGKNWKAEMAALRPTAARRAAARVLLEEPDSVGALTIHTFLSAIPRLGDRQVQRMLTIRAEGWYVWPFRRVDDLTSRQRARLAQELIR